MSPGAFPNFDAKHVHDAVFSPADAVAAVLGDREHPVPEGVVIGYQRALTDQLRSIGAQEVTGFPPPWRSLHLIERPDCPTVGVVCGFGIGAPAAAMVMEELIALGARRFISMGTAGCLQPGFEFGQAVLCTGAVRDEGVSHHYLASEKFSYPAPGLTDRLGDALEARGMGPRRGKSWTVDAPFRETIVEAQSYQAEGIVTVEMEAAALFAVAQHRSVEVASAFVVSDHVLHDQEWRHAFRSTTVMSALVELLGASVDALAH